MDAPLQQSDLLPPAFCDWFAGRGWTPRPHQLSLAASLAAGRSALLIAPTGGGKTLAGFLPSLIEITAAGGWPGLHTLYVSPLKALAVDIARNLERPVADMGLPIRLETRTADTREAKRYRQRLSPPHMLLTTPEQVALLISHRDAARLFAGLRVIVIDELHALAGVKRGDLLALGIARLRRLAPTARVVALSATVADPARLAKYVEPGGQADIIIGKGGAKPVVAIAHSDARIPWSGHSARHALGDVYNAVRAARTALIFVNTRSQAEMIFQALWRINEDGLAIALHHGSLAPEQRRKVEAAMAKGGLRAVVCTSTLDLGVDWGEVDLVIQIGAPKGVSRTVQRIGRSNHRLDQPSRALLVPANRFEVMECLAAIEAIEEGVLDEEAPRPGALDVLAQHVLGIACAGGFMVDALYEEVRESAPYAELARDDFDRVVDFVATGGYALRRYDRYHRLRRRKDGLYAVADPRVARQYRLNVGTIVEAPMIQVRLGRGRVLGKIEEAFIDQLVPGDTFVFAGEVLRFEGLRETSAIVSRSSDEEPMIPSYQGGKFPLSTFLADRVRHILARPGAHPGMPPQVLDWLSMQRRRSILPRATDLLVETFPRARKFYMVAYPFEGRLAHQTLGMLLTRRMERAKLGPLGFVASEYAFAVWSLREPTAIDALFDEDMLGDDLETWLADSNLLKRTFRNVATIAGLIERRYPGREKTGRQMTVSADLIYDVLRGHEPDHVLLRATWADAASGLLDVRRVADMLGRVRGRIVHQRLDRVSPLAVPVMLEIGREAVGQGAMDDLLAEAADQLIEEATRLV